jgi:hypothetical protein
METWNNVKLETTLNLKREMKLYKLNNNNKGKDMNDKSRTKALRTNGS